MKKKPMPAFVINEFYEALLRIKRDQPRRFNLSISARSARCLEYYEAAKERAATEPPKRKQAA